MEEKSSKTLFYAGLKDKGLRIDKFLYDKNLGISRNKIQKLASSGKIRSSGFVVSKNYILKGSETIEIDGGDDLPACQCEPKAEDIKLRIIYEDEYFLAVSKDAGIVVHPAPGHYDNTLVNALINHDKKLRGIGGSLRNGIVHRLDKDTSGIIVVAKDEKTYLAFLEKFKHRLVKKTYDALVLGSFQESGGVINMPIGRSLKERKKMSITIKGRESLTNFKVISQFDKCALVEAHPKTGRTHQIRVHFSYINHPIVGDRDYGNKETKKIAKEIGLRRQFLHARAITFSHPISGIEIDLNDPLPMDLRRCLEKVGRQSL
ncbi:MAG: RluA family pseudouridine synthase [Actinomycetota bacterium]|nr:RluA family pseudouridine synthase [Actinomycetota bacterium]